MVPPVAFHSKNNTRIHVLYMWKMMTLAKYSKNLDNPANHMVSITNHMASITNHMASITDHKSALPIIWSTLPTIWSELPIIFNLCI